MMALICIASCAELCASASLESESYGVSGADEQCFYDALSAREIVYDVRPWDDTTVNWRQYNTVLVRTTWDYSKSERKAQDFSKWLKDLAFDGVQVLNSADIISWNLHKAYLGELESEGVTVIPTEYVKRGADANLHEILAKWGWSTPVLIKPCVSGGSRGCLRVDGTTVSLDQGAAFLRSMVLTGNEPGQGESPGTPADSGAGAAASARSGEGCDMMVQPYVGSVEVRGELSVVTVDGAVSHAVVKQPLPGEFRTQEEHGGVPRAVPVTRAMREAAERVLAAARTCVARANGGRPLSPDALILARCDFLMLGAAAGADGGSDSDSEGTLALLELEAVEPCMFFACSRPGNDSGVAPAAAALVDALVRRLPWLLLLKDSP